MRRATPRLLVAIPAARRRVDGTNGGDGVGFTIDLHAAGRWGNAATVAEGFTVVSYFPDYGAYLEITRIGVV